jgi:uncharacterized protein (DUF488 family)
LKRKRTSNWYDSAARLKQANKTIWTIGHSTHSLEEFVAMLCSFHIEWVVDVRRFPGSRKYPQFNKETLAHSLSQNQIGYEHLEALGGRRKPHPDSKNTVWRNDSFRGYADYMETSEFEKGISALAGIASQHRTAFMCSEAVWWRCHRSMIADYLKFRGWVVMHIMGVGKEEEHPYTGPAKVVGGELRYG